MEYDSYLVPHSSLNKEVNNAALASAEYATLLKRQERSACARDRQGSTLHPLDCPTPQWSFNPQVIQVIACWEGTHHAQKAKFKQLEFKGNGKTETGKQFLRERRHVAF
jgi:hypothetical protein